jgi:cytochrome oxidase Cu insertion factor (SCO1/SenC/PrrC family)
MSTVTAQAKAPLSKSAMAWKLTLLFFPLVIAALLFLLRQAEVRQLRSRSINSYGVVPVFQLTNQDGQAFGSAQLKGKIWIADFIFTRCPGPCPMISSRMSELQKPLEKTDVHLVSVSVDPEHDTPSVLRGYAEKLHAQPQRWDFLTGSKAVIYDLSRNGFKLAVAEDGLQVGVPVHSTRMILVDRRGKIRGYYDATMPDAITKLLADTAHVFREQPRF